MENKDKSHLNNITVTNKTTGESVFITEGISKFCQDRNLRYGTFLIMARGNMKYSEDWFLGTIPPVYVDRKGEKRKPLSKGHRDSIALNLKKSNGNHPDKIKIINIKTLVSAEFINIKEFARENKLAYRSLNSMIKSYCPSVKNWILFKDEYFKPVKINSNKIFENMFDAAKECSTYPWKILKVCNGELEHANNFKFSYYDSSILLESIQEQENLIMEFPFKNSCIQVNETNKQDSGIYIIKNIKNNKFYVGSSVNFYKRFWDHKKWLRLNVHGNTHLQNAWNKYGEESFDFLIEKDISNATEQQLKDIEQGYIDKFWDNGDRCYNISKVAARPDSELAKIPIYQLDKDTREIIKEWPSARDVNNELGIGENGIARCCKGKKGIVGGFRWKYVNEEKAAQYEEFNKPHGGHGKRRCAKINPETNEIIEIYDSLEAAGQSIGVSYVNILGVCAGRGDHIKGMVFRYLDENSNIIPIQRIGETKCEICNVSTFENLRALASHLQYYHKITSEEYVIKYLFNDQRPICKSEGCNNITRYTSFQFKNYCNEHGCIGEFFGGRSRKGPSRKFKQELDSYQCNICSKIEIPNILELARHIKYFHPDKDPKEYVLQNVFDNKMPSCQLDDCNKEVFYDRLVFRKYCENHKELHSLSNKQREIESKKFNKTNSSNYSNNNKSIELLNINSHLLTYPQKSS